MCPSAWRSHSLSLPVRPGESGRCPQLEAQPSGFEMYTARMAIPAGFAVATIRFSASSALGSQPAVVLGVALGTSTPQGVADAIGGWVEDSLLDQLSNSLSVTTVDVVGATEEGQHVVGQAGSQSAAVSPPNVALLVRKSTGQSGRSGRGRTYWPGLLADSEVLDNGTIQSSRVLTLQGLMDDLVGALGSENSASLALINREQQVGIVVTAYQVQSVPATQRRRLRK